MRTGLLALAIALGGCTPATTGREAPAAPPAPSRDCSRQFDENDAGFQTCDEEKGEQAGSE